MKRKTAFTIFSLTFFMGSSTVGAMPAFAETTDVGPASSNVLRACYYFVKSGDTGRGIAGKLGISFSTLRSLNPGVNWDALYVGQRLRVPESSCDW
ncbi:LysM domain-containing protein [Actinomadura sp. WMMB 499]|uniref:LysM peptidoglycan-binding domain-containing protein n=1 Tax=Actinomadura sp. WMMB 499 TaxID=1219491 RepID=UPI00124430F6|nr:LysM peptidoglycan-binding domain-containing protein [Actinomadura sp. WMMB 499]